MNDFDPKIHRVVAVVADQSRPDFGQHVHVKLSELKADMAALDAPATVAAQPTTVSGDRLQFALGLAAVAAAMQVEAGDYRWHGGDADFVWTDGAGVVETMDAYEFVEFCRMKFNGG